MFVCGSTGLGKVARAKGWKPGYFDENLDYRLLVENYGVHLLNADARTATLRELGDVADLIFVRPVGDGKQFAGEVMTRAAFLEWRQRVAYSTRSRTPFRCDGGQHSAVTADTVPR